VTVLDRGRALEWVAGRVVESAVDRVRAWVLGEPGYEAPEDTDEPTGAGVDLAAADDVVLWATAVAPVEVVFVLDPPHPAITAASTINTTPQKNHVRMSPPNPSQPLSR
jgi:hypothetical protein